MSLETPLMHAEDGYELVQERMKSDDWWVVVSVNEPARSFVRELEHEFYMDNNNDKFEVLMMMVPGMGMVAVCMFHKSECSVEQMRQFTAKAEHTGLTGPAEPSTHQDILLPCSNEDEALIVGYVAAYFAQDVMPTKWPPESFAL